MIMVASRTILAVFERWTCCGSWARAGLIRWCSVGVVVKLSRSDADVGV